MAASSHHPDSSLGDRVLRLLEDEVNRAGGPVLPSIRQLAACFGVSPPIVSRAARILRDRGMVSFTRGQRIHIAGRSVEPEPDRPSSSEALASRIRDQIGKGDLRAGQPLPKVATLAGESRVSNTTVLRACRVLEEEGLISKKGKVWLVGTMPEATPRAWVKPSPQVIVMLQEGEQTWRSLYRSERTSAFCAQFMAELERYGVRTVAAFTSSEKVPIGTRHVGMAQVRELIRDLDERYLGTLIVSSRAEIPDLGIWANELPAYRKPVVWFDRIDENMPDRPASRLFTRCHFHERGAAQLAVETLAAMGHTKAVYPTPGGLASDWMMHRLNLLQQAGHRAGLQISHHFEVSPQREASARDRTLGHTRLFRKVIREDPNATAIIACYDYGAYYFYHWLCLAGIGIPEQFSLISFDNYSTVHSLPISSIDFGFGHLGYCAFHVLFGLIPIRRARNGDIPSKPGVMDRGSVAPPRKGALRAPAEIVGSIEPIRWQPEMPMFPTYGQG